MADPTIRERLRELTEALDNGPMGSLIYYVTRSAHSREDDKRLERLRAALAEARAALEASRGSA